MATISITTPSDGQTIDASDVATPLNTIVTEINGNLDSNNIDDGGVVPNNLTSGTGTSWAWQSYTPTLSGFSGTPTVTARYTQIGKTVHVAISVNGTSNSTTKYFSLPVAPATWQNGLSIGMFLSEDGTTFYTAAWVHRTSTPNVQVYRGFNQATATSPVTPWSSSGTAKFQGSFTYEAA